MATPTLFQDRNSGLHRLHPLTKLALSGFLIAAALALPGIWQVLAVYAAGLIPLASWGKVLAIFLRTSARLIWPFVISLLLIQGFFTPGDTVWLELGPFALTAEGILLGARFAARLLVWLGAAVLLMLATRPDMLMLSLTELGLPRQAGYIILTSLQIIPQFQARAETILNAQRSRGLETQGSLITRLKALVPLVVPLILSSIIDLDQRAIALETRAIKHPGPKTSFLELQDSRLQVTLRVVMVMAIPAVLGLRLWFEGVR